MSDLAADWDAIAGPRSNDTGLASDWESIPAKKVAAAPAVKASDLPWYESVIEGFKDPFKAGAQLATRLPAAGALSKVASAVNRGPFGGPFTETMADLKGSVDSGISRQEQTYQAQRPSQGIDWWRGAGNIANPVNWIGGGTGLAANMARGAASSALTLPVSQAGSDADFWRQKGIQAGTGAAVAGALTPVANAVGRMINPQTAPEVKKLIDAGITPTPGQIMGGWAHRLEDAATSIPFLGDAIRSAQGRGIREFNIAVYQRALDPVKEKVPQNVGREGVEYVANKLGEKYDAILPRLSFRPDRTFAGDLATLRGFAATLPEAQQKQFDSVIKAQLGKASPSGGMTGETLKGVLSELRRKAKGYTGDASFDNRELGAALNELHGALSRALQRSNPVKAAELKAIDTGWANYARIRHAAAAQGATDGVFTPAQLSNAVKTLDKSVGKGDFAKGNALLQDLSDAGKNVLAQRVPDSGTPLRSITGFLAGGGLTYLGSQNPAVALGTIGSVGAAALPYTQTGQRAISKILTERPDISPQLAEALKRGLIATSAPASAAILGQGGR